jgi:hypothetical protein
MATTSTAVSLSTSAYTDLGAGPIYLGAAGGGVIYQIADSQPALGSGSFNIQPFDAPRKIDTTAHIWALAPTAGAKAIVSAGSGISSTTNGAAYTLAAGVNAAGSTTPVTGVIGGSYIFACTASNWNSATAQLQALGPDGTTWLNVGTAMSANGTQGVVIGANASVRVTVTGTPTGLNASIS